ncbi:MAG: alpha/beta fold hydrolase [Nocardioides sp.]
MIDVSDELFARVSDEPIDVCYQTFGDPTDEPLLLVMGLGGPMTWWDPDLCARLASLGFFVCRYDNRDTGRSTKLAERIARTTLVRAFAGRPVQAAYTMDDLAADAFGLMDHLGWESAHVVGVSMGGMIAQTMALTAPERVRTLTSIMSTTGHRNVGWQHPRLATTLLAPRGPGRRAYVEASATLWKMIGPPGFPQDHAALAARAEETYDRGFSAQGVLRQMLAVLTQPNRTKALGALRMPVLVIHGSNDKMVHASGGRATAAAIPGAELVLIDGMGHDLPPQLFARFAEDIRLVADRAQLSAPAEGD